ncbi:TorF family putative porin [Cupriavidus sp. 2TAF22]|uniref:TorF family putative porin n=1 Tax=unclassified Cupriavidus TaxID=2640874 RepID=UPI003F8EA348
MFAPTTGTPSHRPSSPRVVPAWLAACALLACAAPVTAQDSGQAAQAAEANAPEAAPAEPAGPYTFTGHLDAVSRYVLRGATTTYGNGAPLGNAGGDAPESSRPALQWGVDLAHESGWSIGYWASMINYSYQQLGNSYSDRSITSFQTAKSIENDFYGAYSGKIVGDLGYTVGMTAYYYINGSHANALESRLGLSYGPFSLNAQTLLNDVVWGNKGDTYWTLVYTKTLPYGITFTGTVGAYTYKKEGKYLGTTDTLSGTSCGPHGAFVVNGCFAGNTPYSGAFRHLTLALAAPIPGTPLSAGLQWIIGGYNRFGVHQENRVLASVSYGF